MELRASGELDNDCSVELRVLGKFDNDCSMELRALGEFDNDFEITFKVKFNTGCPKINASIKNFIYDLLMTSRFLHFYGFSGSVSFV